MPFAVFRRHQRKLLAVFAILAMGAFVLSDTLVRFSSGNYGRNVDPVVVELYGRKIRRSDLGDMTTARNNANLFMQELMGLLTGRAAPNFFGDLSTRSIVDALILEHEADKLKMPRGPEVARQWLRKATSDRMDSTLFELILARFGNRVSGEQLLSEIADQIRIANVAGLIGEPVVTPLDVYSTYRDQNERVSARAVGFPVDDFIAKVKDPGDAELRAYYEKYKDILPDPDRDTPGFKVPRKIRAEILSVDGTALARAIRENLTDAELRTYYENHKSEYRKPSFLPDDLFANDPKATLTPPLVQSFDEARDGIAIALADEKAQAEIVNKFTRVKEEVMIPFEDKYLEAADGIAEAEKQGETPKAVLPKPESLKGVAKQEKMEYEVTPLLSRDQAEQYGRIADAEVGLNKLSGARKFAAELFAPKSSLFEPVELTDVQGRRYLVRKTEDLPPRVPPLDEIRAEVVHAWKAEQARPLAEKAARGFAELARKDGGKIKAETVQGHKVITTDMLSKMQPSVLPGQFFPTGPPVPTEIPQLPHAGEALRDALFGLKAGEVAVAPDEPKQVYYVLALKDRIPATFATLYAPTGDYYRYQFEASNSAARHQRDAWMDQLRADAGLKPDWVPPDEAKRQAEEES
jgi:peptidyl-prolyl cis-trans isomerase D